MIIFSCSCIDRQIKSIYRVLRTYRYPSISGYKNGLSPLVFLFLSLCLSLLFCFVFLPWFTFSALDQFL